MKPILKKAPRPLRKVLVSVFIMLKTIIGVMAFKTIETALHHNGFVDWVIAGVVTMTILIPAFGLQALLEEVD